MTAGRPRPNERDERVALPLDAETALRALLAVQPLEDRDDEPQAAEDDTDKK